MYADGPFETFGAFNSLSGLEMIYKVFNIQLHSNMTIILHYSQSSKWKFELTGPDQILEFIFI